jgi:hypothetical protein
MMKEPVVFAPKFCSFLSHIFSQASQNVTVIVNNQHFLCFAGAWLPLTLSSITEFFLYH